MRLRTHHLSNKRSDKSCSRRQSSVRKPGAPLAAFMNYRLLMSWGLLGWVLLLMLRLIGPLILLFFVLVGFSGGGWLLWERQQQARVRSRRQDARLTYNFYQLLDHCQGRISALELAMKSKLSAKTASRYLHRQAQDFGAYFERTVQGDVIYIFNPAVIYAWSAQTSGYLSDYAAGYDPVPYAEPSSAEMAWAYAERQRQQDERDRHTARANARQLRALHNLSGQNALCAQSLPDANNQREVLAVTRRGKAIEAVSGVVTIDVKAVNG